MLERIIDIIDDNGVDTGNHIEMKGILSLHKMPILDGRWKKITSKTIQNSWIVRGLVVERESVVKEGVIDNEVELPEHNMSELPTTN